MSTQAIYFLPEQRAKIITTALDFALEQEAGILPLKEGRRFSTHDALHAVRLSHYRSQTVAESALAWLSRRDVSDTEIRCINGHHVLLDTITGKIHDLEVPEGCRSRRDLPCLKRTRAFNNLASTGSVPERHEKLIFERYASDLLTHREKMASRVEAEQADHYQAGTNSKCSTYNRVIRIACFMVFVCVLCYLLHLGHYLKAWAIGIYFVGTALIWALMVKITHCHDSYP